MYTLVKSEQKLHFSFCLTITFINFIVIGNGLFILHFNYLQNLHNKNPNKGFLTTNNLNAVDFCFNKLKAMRSRYHLFKNFLNMIISARFLFEI